MCRYRVGGGKACKKSDEIVHGTHVVRTSVFERRV